jgi:hypothetical protein
MKWNSRFQKLWDQVKIVGGVCGDGRGKVEQFLSDLHIRWVTRLFIEEVDTDTSKEAPFWARSLDCPEHLQNHVSLYRFYCSYKSCLYILYAVDLIQKRHTRHYGAYLMVQDFAFPHDRAIPWTFAVAVYGFVWRRKNRTVRIFARFDTRTAFTRNFSLLFRVKITSYQHTSMRKIYRPTITITDDVV